MRKIIVVLLVLVLMVTMSNGVAAEDGAYINIGDYNETVLALHQKLSDLGYYSLRPESPWSEKSVSALKQLQYDNGWNPTGVVEGKDQYEAILAITEKNKNLIPGCTFEWSDWMTPEYDKQNRCFTIAKVNLGEKHIGDQYECSIEIEFKDVTATDGQQFAFWTQGPIDDSWSYFQENVWNWNLIRLADVPENGTYYYRTTNQITENTVNLKAFNMGFRCDYWSSGTFRVRNVKIETIGFGVE